MTKTKLCELWAARILYEKTHSMSAMKELLSGMYEDVVRNHEEEERRHTSFNGFEYETKTGDY